MGDINRVTLTGRIGNNPELKRTTNGTSVCTISIAVQKNQKPTNGQPDADWIDCVLWRKTAEFICRYAGKGSKIAIDGSFTTRSWTDKNGNKQKRVEVNVKEAYLSESKKNDNPAPDVGFEATDFAEITEDDSMLPF